MWCGGLRRCWRRGVLLNEDGKGVREEPFAGVCQVRIGELTGVWASGGEGSAVREDLVSVFCLRRRGRA